MSQSRRSMRYARFLTGVLFLAAAAVSPLYAQAKAPTIVAYTYSSFASYGAADVVSKAFTAATGAGVQFVATGDSRAMLAKLIAERDAAGQPPADVFIGVEANDLGTAKAHDVFMPLSSSDIPNLATVPESLLFDPDKLLIPYEHGFITIVYDSTKLSPDRLPKTLDDLLDPKYSKALVVEDPRTSSPGLSFLLWTVARYGQSGYIQYWKRLMPNVLTISPSWDAAFDLFSKGEAPMMVSFSTDHAYDVISNQSQKIQVLTPDGQGYRTIFGMGIVKGTRNLQLAKKLLDIILSPDVQSQLPETEWMFTANPQAAVPADWQQYSVVPAAPIFLPPSQTASSLSGLLDRWVNEILGG